MLTLNGNQGKSVVVEGDVVKIIKAAGVFSAARERTLPIRNITSVEVKKPGSMFAGFIQFSIGGGKARDASLTLSGGAFDAAKDENSVLFIGDENYRIATEIKSYIESWAAQAAKPAQSFSAADEILKLKQLLDQGILTEEEFAAKKKQLLGI